MSIPFVDRPPTEAEIERFRLFLSSHQDRLGNYFAKGEPVFSWLFKDVLVAALNIPSDEPKPPSVNTFVSAIVNRERKYAIYLKSFYSYEMEKFCRKNLIHSFTPSQYWSYLSRFGTTQQNYKENPSQIGSASIDLMRREEKGELEKSFYLFLLVGDEQSTSPRDVKKEFCFRLAQYYYPIDSYLINPTTLRWLISEEEDPDRYLRFKTHRKLVTFLRGYENDDLIFEIKIPEEKSTPLPDPPLPSRKKQKTTRKSVLDMEF